MQQPAPPPASPGEALSRAVHWDPDIAFRRRARTVVDYINPKPGDRILDAGCGLGFYLYLLGQVTEAELFGVELSTERLATAAAQRTISRATLTAGDVTRMPYRDGTFDSVILSEVLEHLPDDRAALVEAFRVLRPGGVLAITVPNRSYPFLWDPLNGARERLGLGHFTNEPWSGIWTDHQRLYSAGELVDLVHANGFEISDVHLETRHSMPFAHHLVYGVGKFLVNSGAAGDGAGDRSAFWGREPSPLMRTAIRLFTAVDRFNRPRYHKGAAVNVCLRAVKPARA